MSKDFVIGMLLGYCAGIGVGIGFHFLLRAFDRVIAELNSVQSEIRRVIGRFS
jgi:capsular polysaccharide biosynthesis protein